MFTALERGNCPRPPRSGEKIGGHTLVLDSGREAAGDSRQDSGSGCLGCRREGQRQLAQLPPEWMDSAGCCSGGGLGCPGRLGLKRLGRLASRRSGVDGSGGAARMAQLTDDGNGSPNGHTCLVRVKVRVKGRRSVARGRGAGHVRQGEGSSRRWESSGSGGGGQGGGECGGEEAGGREAKGVGGAPG